MSAPVVAFESVWKKFRRGERHDSLRDLIPALVRRAVGGTRSADLGEREFWALRDVSFEVRAGEALGIIGPNGAGKSTALKLLTRIMKPTRGRCEVHGRVGALIELAAGFHPDLTGRENVYLQGAIMGMSQRDIRQRFDAIVDFAGIPAFIDTPVKRYSSGMNARLGFAIAANLDPEVLLIDEALAVGDMSFQQKCYDFLKDIRASGAAIVFVSHNMQAVASISDRVLLLRAQSEPVVGGVDEILSAYRRMGAASRDGAVAVEVTATSLCDPDTGKPIVRVQPTAPLVLRTHLAVGLDLPRCCVAFEVVRHDGLIVFDGSPAFEGNRPVDLSAGTVLEFEVRFRANLLRGVYNVNLHLVDERRDWKAIRIPAVGTFTVYEQSRVQGVAELQPTYSIRTTESARSFAEAETP